MPAYPSGKWFPGSQWVPGSQWTPSEIEDMAIANNDLSENQTMVVVYAHAAGADREVTTQPYGTIFIIE